jgi:hypothetical protein
MESHKIHVPNHQSDNFSGTVNLVGIISGWLNLLLQTFSSQYKLVTSSYPRYHNITEIAFPQEIHQDLGFLRDVPRTN